MHKLDNHLFMILLPLLSVKANTIPLVLEAVALSLRMAGTGTAALSVLVAVLLPMSLRLATVTSASMVPQVVA